MTFREGFEAEIRERVGDRIEDQGGRPTVEVWPGEDDFADWVTAHKDRVRGVICASPEFKDAPFCGPGYH